MNRIILMLLLVVWANTVNAELSQEFNGLTYYYNNDSKWFSQIGYQDVKKYCSELKFKELTGWRMPTIAEMRPALDEMLKIHGDKDEKGMFGSIMFFSSDLYYDNGRDNFAEPFAIYRESVFSRSLQYDYPARSSIHPSAFVCVHDSHASKVTPPKKPEQIKNDNSSNATIGLKLDTSAAEKAAAVKADEEAKKKLADEDNKKQLADTKWRAKEKQAKEAKADAEAKRKAQIPAKCVYESTDSGASNSEAEARAQAQRYAEAIGEGVTPDGRNRIISINISCTKAATQTYLQYTCVAKTKYERDNPMRTPCGKSGPSTAVAK